MSSPEPTPPTTTLNHALRAVWEPWDPDIHELATDHAEEMSRRAIAYRRGWELRCRGRRRPLGFWLRAGWDAAPEPQVREERVAELRARIARGELDADRRAIEATADAFLLEQVTGDHREMLRGWMGL